MDTRNTQAPRRAISYARFSYSKQADGFSLERQLEAAAAYCRRNNLTLDEQSFTDTGVSAFHGANARRGALSEFIALVESGRIPGARCCWSRTSTG